MPKPQRQRLATGDPRRQWLITDDGSRTLWDARLDETFHSGCGAVSESLQVYLINSGVAARLQRAQPNAILEFGFGTGTTFLLTAALALTHQAPLRYVALEHDLLPIEIIRDLDLENVLANVLHLHDWQVEYPRSLSGVLSTAQLGLERLFDTINKSPGGTRYSVNLSPQVSLDLCLMDARLFSRNAGAQAQDRNFDAIFFDAFAPEKDPVLWTAETFASAFEMLAPGGTLASYCVKSSVRQLLLAAGFNVCKMPGPAGGKREVLLARKPRQLHKAHHLA